MGKNMKTHPTCFAVEDHPTWKVVILVIVSPRFVGYTVLLMAKLTQLLTTYQMGCSSKH